ncbi:MAG: hypothetical protein KDK39_11740 [Leptospiraceae bacterium]|nr:hypothetical protein [Leptospiraceae bacterium]
MRFHLLLQLSSRRLFIGALFVALVGIQSQEKSATDPAAPSELDEYIQVRPFSQGQKERYDSLIGQIALVQTKIESYYEHLKRNGEDDCLLHHGGEKIYCQYYTIPEDNVTWVPLQATKVSLYGRREKMMYNEMAYFRWQGTKIVEYFFETRKGYLGNDHTLHRLFYGNSIAGDAKSVDETKPPMGLVINEVLPTGKGTLARFAFAESNKVFDKQHDQVEINGKKITLGTIYLREPEERLRVVRKYLDLLKRLEMRLQWNVHIDNERRKAQLDSILRESY